MLLYHQVSILEQFLKDHVTHNIDNVNKNRKSTLIMSIIILLSMLILLSILAVKNSVLLSQE